MALFLSDNQYFEGPASHTVAGKPDVTGGKVVGNLRGNYMEFNVDWLNGVTKLLLRHDRGRRNCTRLNAEQPRQEQLDLPEQVQMCLGGTGTV